MEKNANEKEGPLYSRIVSLRELMERQYVIPVYQRPYEWGLIQLERIMDSVSAYLEKATGKADDYLFLGSMQFNIRENGTYEVVDGQQRIITFLLLTSVLKKLDLNYTEGLKTAQLQNCSIMFENNVKYEVLKNNREYFRNKSLTEIDYGMISESILFSEVVTKKEEDAEKLLGIFTAMNMEGLPLKQEDIFKTKFASLMKGDDSNHIIDRINKKYEAIHKYNQDSDTCELSEYNIIDAFRYYVVENLEKLQTATAMKSNPITLLTSAETRNAMKQEKSFEDGIDIKVFESIADSLIKTQKIIDEKNKEIFDQSQTIWFARELIGEARYWNLRNIVYYLVYKMSVTKGDPQPVEVESALKVSEKIWQYCSFHRAWASKVIKKVYDFVIESVIRPKTIDVESFGEDDVAEINKVESSDLMKMINGDCFTGNLPHLMLDLSYFDDACQETGITIGEIKKKVFYRWRFLANVAEKEDKNIEIEHIISQRWDGDVGIEIINSIGNLMYLERNVNRALGERLGRQNKDKVDSYERDMEEIKLKKDELILSYYSSKLCSVQRFLGGFDLSQDDIVQTVCKRSESKREFILALYAKNGIYLK